MAGPRPEGRGKPPLPDEPGQGRKTAAVGRTVGAWGVARPSLRPGVGRAGKGVHPGRARRYFFRKIFVKP